MHACTWAVLLASAASVGCGALYVKSGDSHSLSPAQAAEVENGVRAFAHTVAQDVTRDGPAAWRKHFAGTPSFFMAADGYLVFPDSASATTGIQDLTRAIKQIDLRWGDQLRVDPLAPDLAMMSAPYREIRVDAAGSRVDETGFFTGLVEYKEGRWQFRNAHWSSAR
jgi:hypothetical protein